MQSQTPQQNFPEQYIQQTRPQYGTQSEIYYQSSEVSEISNLMRETINHGLLDCGAAKTVAGSLWYTIYLDSLSTSDREKVSRTPSSSKFKFGDGETIESLYSTTIPCVLGKKELLLTTEIVEENIPLLLSSETMKRLKINLNFEHDQITIFGNSHPVGVTSTGHYVIPLKVKAAELTFLSFKEMMKDQVPKACARRLHLNFAHADSSKIIKLMRTAGVNARNVEEELTQLESNCDTCLKVKRAKPRPKVCIPLSDTFNGCVAVDLKMIKTSKHKFWILHITDTFTRYSMGVVVKDKGKEEVIAGLFRWIGIFGRPGRMISDNGGEFDNHALRELSSRLNVIIHMTAVEAPWSNGICERGNSSIGELTVKVLEDVDCSPEVALQWAVNARNTLINIYGFSPQQLVLGRNSSLEPFEVNLPSLNQSSINDYVAQNLNAIAAARNAFQEKESSVRLNRAMRTRSSYTTDCFMMGDQVYYRRENRKEWLGPAFVIGATSGVVWIDHGCIVKIHPCKVRLKREVDNDLNDRDCIQNEDTSMQVSSQSQDQTSQPEDYTSQSEEHYNQINAPRLSLPPLYYNEEDEQEELNTNFQTDDWELQDLDGHDQSHLKHLLERQQNEPRLETEDDRYDSDEGVTVLEPKETEDSQFESDEEVPPLESRSDEESNDQYDSKRVLYDCETEIRLNSQPIADMSNEEVEYILDGLRATLAKDVQLQEDQPPNDESEELLMPRQASTPCTDDTSSVKEDTHKAKDKLSDSEEHESEEHDSEERDSEEHESEDDQMMISATEAQDNTEDHLTVRDMITGKNVPRNMLQAFQNTIKSSIGFVQDQNNSSDEVKQSLDFISKSEDSSRESTPERLVKPDNVILLEVPCKRYHEKDVQEAMMKELQQFKEYDVYEEAEDTGMPCISTRWVVTEKTSTENGLKTTKARLVCRGFEESVNEQLDSPTVDKVSIRFFFSVMMANSWKCESLDVKGAFLQSEDLEREVYVKPPTGLSDGKVWRLRKPMYGLKDAARKWFLTLRNELKKLGCEQSTIDLCMFTYHVEGKLCGMFVTHVDDFLIAGNDIFKKNVIEVIKQTFHISKHELDIFAYVGLEVKQTKQSVLITQRKYLSNITPVEIDQSKMKKGRLLSESEITKYRSLLGKLSWMVTQTRPDYKVSVLEASLKTKEPKVEDMKNLNHILAMMNTNPGYSLSIINLGHIDKLTISVYCDAAYSMGGVAKEGNLIFLTNGALCNIISWTSKKVKGTCLHSFDAEMYAVVDAIKEAIFINELITETMKLKTGLRIIIHCDCDSLRKKLYSDTSNPKTNRKQINWIRDRLECGDINLFEWIPGTEQIADALTKVKSSTQQKMNLALNNNIHPWAVGDRSFFGDQIA